MTEEDEGRMTWEEIMGRRVGRVVEGLWEGRTQREKSRKERGDWGSWTFGRGRSG
jgi:hypothetical protein